MENNGTVYADIFNVQNMWISAPMKMQVEAIASEKILEKYMGK